MQRNAPIELSLAFQTALGVLLTNSDMVRRFIAREIDGRELHDALTDADIDGLGRLVGAEPDRVMAVAELLTSRRRRRVVNALRATVQMSGERFESLWKEYLRCHAPRGILSMSLEATMFGKWLLPRLERGSPQWQILTYELCRSDIAERLRLRARGTSDAKSATLADHSRLCLSRCVRLERFEFAVDEVMARFRRTGEIVTGSSRGPVHLVFHPQVGRVTTVGVTKVSAAMSSILARSATGSALHELLGLIPAQMHAPLRAALEKLVDIHVLDLVG